MGCNQWTCVIIKIIEFREKDAFSFLITPRELDQFFVMNSYIYLKIFQIIFYGYVEDLTDS